MKSNKYIKQTKPSTQQKSRITWKRATWYIPTFKFDRTLDNARCTHLLPSPHSFFFLLKLLLPHPYLCLYNFLLFLHIKKTQNESAILSWTCPSNQARQKWISQAGEELTFNQTYKLLHALLLLCFHTTIFNRVVRSFTERASDKVKNHPFPNSFTLFQHHNVHNWKQLIKLHNARILCRSRWLRRLHLKKAFWRKKTITFIEIKSNKRRT